MEIDKNINEQLYTIGDYVRWAASTFSTTKLSYGHGTDNALDDAFQLVTRSLHLPHEFPPYMVNSRLTNAEKNNIIDLVTRRVKQQIPTPYLLNEAWFAGVPFYVDENVLIPRSPIAELIEGQFEPWIESKNIANILDICTGSGCIAIACALAFPNSECVGTDISDKALDIANKNARNLHVEDNVSIIKSDVFEGLDKNKKFDIIVSNPPYVDGECMAALPQEYLHEPRIALAAGKDGLAIVSRIIDRAKEFLSPNGILVVEVGNSQQALIEKYPDLPFIWLDFERGGQGVFVLTDW